jgi:hypothetical protein
MIYEIQSLKSGECRCIGREDIHVYCYAPCVETMMPWGRKGWIRGPASYCVVCPEAGLEHGEWVDAPRAAELVEKILKAG